MDERESLARAWFAKAEDDLRSAECLLSIISIIRGKNLAKV